MIARRLHAIPILLLVACGSTSSGAPGAAADGGAADVATADAPTGDAGTRSDACLAQDAALQAVVDGARGSDSKNALLAVRNADCGTSTYVSGDPQNATKDSLWRIGSITKTFTAAAVMSLVQEGKISLDDPLSKWISAPNTAGVTVRTLLDHRSGIFNYSEDAAFSAQVDASPGTPRTPQSLVDVATAHPQYFAANTDFHYSNTNYILLGMIVEAVTGMKISAVIRARAIGPAKLANTFFDGEETVDASRVAHGFGASDKDFSFVYHPSLLWTAGAMVGTGADMADWVAALYGSTAVLSVPTRALMLSPATGGAGSGYGFGVSLVTAWTPTSGGAEGHNGNIDGYFTDAYYFSEKKTAVVAFVNQTQAADLQKTMDAAVKTLFP